MPQKPFSQYITNQSFRTHSYSNTVVTSHMAVSVRKKGLRGFESRFDKVFLHLQKWTRPNLKGFSALCELFIPLKGPTLGIFDVFSEENVLRALGISIHIIGHFEFLFVDFFPVLGFLNSFTLGKSPFEREGLFRDNFSVVKFSKNFFSESNPEHIKQDGNV